MEFSAKGHIHIEINKVERTLSFSDNGCGIESSELPRLLAPFSSTKATDANSVGEKGVTFVLFSSNDFKIDTSTQNSSASAALTGALAWLSEETETTPKLNLGAGERPEQGTRVVVRLPQGHPLFGYTIHDLLFILQTKTALGDTSTIFRRPKFDCDFELRVIEHDGASKQIERECVYLLPSEVIDSKNFKDVDEYIDWRTEGDRSDAAKRNYWRNKAAVRTGSAKRTERSADYWCCFVPSRHWWQEMSEKAQLSSASEEIEHLDDDPIAFRGELSLATKGAPSGVSVDLRPRGSAGYVPNFFVLVDDPKLEFDIGRKSISGFQKTELTSIAYEQYRYNIQYSKVHLWRLRGQRRVRQRPALRRS